MHQATGELVISLMVTVRLRQKGRHLKPVDKINEGYDVVYGYFAHGHKHILRRLGTFINKKMAEALIDPAKTSTNHELFIAKYIIVETSSLQKSIPILAA